jgi:osmoprotectant transport system substrate-binding protein
MKTEVYDENAEKFDDLLGQVSEALTDDKLTELNARVDVDGEDPKDVAADFLSEIGLA